MRADILVLHAALAALSLGSADARQGVGLPGIGVGGSLLPPARQQAVIEVFETIGVTDDAAVVPPAIVELVESIAVADGAGVVPPAIVELAEVIGVADGTAVAPPAVIAVEEMVSVQDGLPPMERSEPTFTVTAADDADDASCTISHCSLREAINAANAYQDRVTIAFDVPGAGPHAIRPGSPLPIIEYPMTIDGYTEPGASPNTNGPDLGNNAVLMIELDGSSLGSGSGLQIESSGSTVRGLAITNVPDGGDGIVVLFGDENRIQGNFIGIDVGGAEAAGNDYGVVVSAGAQRNVIGTDGDGTDDLAERNVISGNRSGGILMQRGPVGAETDHNVVAGNLIGTDASGTEAVGNLRGILISTGPRFNRIGSDGDGQSDDVERNVISGNTNEGVRLLDNVGAGSAENVIAGNYIGTDVSGAAGVGNTFGIRLSTPSNVIGSPGNVVSGNRASGVLLEGEASGNAIVGNRIGTDATGTATVPNGGDGIQLAGGSVNTIGGVGPDDGNVISGNNVGVAIARASDGNRLMGNRIGTDLTGAIALPNSVDGIAIESSHNSVGGRDPGEGNVIAAHPGNAILIQWAGDETAVPEGNLIRGNTIGSPAPGPPETIPGQGISIDNAIGTVVGGRAESARNTISGNGFHGVVVDGDRSAGNEIARNTIFDNGELGIDLRSPEAGHVTPNDALDADVGPNGLQNFPILTRYEHRSGTITGTLNSAPGGDFLVHLYVSAVCDASGYGEGQRWLGEAAVTTDGLGNASFGQQVEAVDFSAYLTATASGEAGGGTSEFSRCLPAGFTVQELPELITAEPVRESPSGSHGFVLQADPDAGTPVASVELCGVSEVRLSAGDRVAVGCGSAHIGVEVGPVEVVITDDLVASVPVGGTARLDRTPDEQATIENTSAEGSAPITLVSGGQEVGTITAGEAVQQSALAVHHPRIIRPTFFQNRDLFLADGTLTPSAGSDGFDPAAEAVTLAFGDFGQTIPAGAFTPLPPFPLPGAPDPLSYLYVSAQPGIALMSIGPDGTFGVVARRLDLDGLDLALPVPMTLRIGDDVASAALHLDDNGGLVGPAAAMANGDVAPYEQHGSWLRPVMAWPSAATVGPGGVATYALAVGMGGEPADRDVTVSCATLPPGVTCSFEPEVLSVEADGAISVLTVSTTNLRGNAGVTAWLPDGAPWILLLVSFGALGLVRLVRPRRARRLALAATAALTLLAIGLQAGCTEDVTGVGDPHPATPLGRYQIEVVATAGDVVHARSVTLTVGEAAAEPPGR